MKANLYLTLIFISLVSFAQKDPVYSTKKGAIKGYDPVAYFTAGEATKGDQSIKYEWNDATWYFSSEENKNVFKADPEKYAPQFGGYCAYAVSQGYTYSSSPDAWKIVDDKLYLNFNKDVQKKWLANQSELIKQAEANWPKVIE